MRARAHILTYLCRVHLSPLPDALAVSPRVGLRCACVSVDLRAFVREFVLLPALLLRDTAFCALRSSARVKTSRHTPYSRLMSSVWRDPRTSSGPKAQRCFKGPTNTSKRIQLCHTGLIRNKSYVQNTQYWKFGSESVLLTVKRHDVRWLSPGWRWPSRPGLWRVIAVAVASTPRDSSASARPRGQAGFTGAGRSSKKKRFDRCSPENDTKAPSCAR